MEGPISKAALSRKAFEIGQKIASSLAGCQNPDPKIFASMNNLRCSTLAVIHELLLLVVAQMITEF